MMYHFFQEYLIMEYPSSKLLYNIDKINKNVEWAKIDLLKRCSIFSFINSLTNCSYNEYIKYLNDYKNDKKFKKFLREIK